MTKAQQLRTNALPLLCIIMFVLYLILERNGKELVDGSSLVPKPESRTVAVKFAGFDESIHYTALTASGKGQKDTVVLLHGMSFTADTWEGTGTMQALWAAGFNAIAVDLPGHGKSEAAGPLPVERRDPFLGAFLAAAGIESAHLVAASMGGTYAFPHLAQHTAGVQSFCSVAAVGIGRHEAGLRAAGAAAAGAPPALLVWGSRDDAEGRGLKEQAALLRARTVVIEGAGHACYMDDPEAFNRELLGFLRAVRSARDARQGAAVE